ncbi:hypothetical protein [Erwinia sp. E_sp_B01_9]|uniref:hypothetical protein n=1 Tax=Erwinia sp. E_sp_B01_9 TaxID=3039403 RepID=UPI003D9B8CDF
MRQLALSSATLVTMQLERTDGGLARSSVFSASRWSPLRLRSSSEAARRSLSQWGSAGDPGL